MSTDIFGYERNIQPASMLSPDNAVLDFGDGKVSLVQEANVSYGHNVSPVFETGSSNIFFVQGGAQGSLTVASAVGKNGFLDTVKMGGQACGELSTLSLTATESSCGFKLEKNKAARMEGVILKGVAINFRAGQYQVMQTLEFVIGKLMITQ